MVQPAGLAYQDRATLDHAIPQSGGKKLGDQAHGCSNSRSRRLGRLPVVRSKDSASIARRMEIAGRKSSREEFVKQN